MGSAEHRLGSAPLPTQFPTVSWRGSLDLNPLHVDDPQDRRWLAPLIWPEQTDRGDRLDSACDIVAADPPTRGDAHRPPDPPRDSSR